MKLEDFENKTSYSDYTFRRSRHHLFALIIAISVVIYMSAQRL